MRITMDDLTVGFTHLNREALLEEWRWLVGEDRQAILITALGDAVLQEPSGACYLLDTGVGSLDPIAASLDELRELLVDSEFVTDVMVPQAIVDLRQAGKHLQQGQLYGCKRPLVLGGELSVENLEPTDIEVHFSLLGQIHRQVKDLPPGTPIESITLEEG